MTDWTELALHEGRLYCAREDTWCFYTDFETGSCRRGSCVHGGMKMYCKCKDRFCPWVDPECGECGAAGDGCRMEEDGW